MRVVPRIIRNIRPGMQKCVPGYFIVNEECETFRVCLCINDQERNE